MTATSRREQQLRKLSRFLSMLLRHRPSRFPLALDDQGWVPLSDVMRILRGLPNFRWARRADIDEIMASRGRAKFEMVQDGRGTRIRALYGHTAVRPTYEPVVPHDVLYAAIAPERASEVQQQGLASVETSYVELAGSPEEARRLASRQIDAPVVFAVDAAAAHAAGCAFYSPTEGVVLVERVPLEYLTHLA